MAPFKINRIKDVRKDLLDQLLNINNSMTSIINGLNKLSWDSNELVNLNRGHLLNVLKQYQEGKIDTNKVEDGANAIESREDIGRENNFKDLIHEILYELANPYLTEQLTKKRAISLVDKLNKDIDQSILDYKNSDKIEINYEINCFYKRSEQET